MAVLLKLSVLFPILLCSVVECLDILMVQPSPFNADNILGYKLATALLKRGHQIIMISPFPTPRDIRELYSANYTAVPLTKMPKLVEKVQKYKWLKDDKRTRKLMENAMAKMIESLFTEENVQTLMKSNAKFRLVILTHFSNVHIGIGQHFKAPLILLETRTPLVLNKLLLGNPLAIPYVPAPLGYFYYTNPLHYLRRMLNLAEFCTNMLSQGWSVLPNQRAIFKKYFKTDLELDDVLYNNISLMLTNSHFAVTGVAPLVPAIIEIGGFHIEPGPKIPIELKTLFDNAKDGVVIFSTDSRSKDLNKVEAAVRGDILRAFAQINQVVLWDFNPDDVSKPNSTETPKNVFIKKLSHFHREQLLSHLNVRALISDGSLLTTLEAIHHGIPILGLPLIYDDETNIATAVADGYALSIPLRDVNEQRLTIALNQIVNDTKYRREAQRRSRIMRDQPLLPMEKAIFWIEHVIRHKGAAHLRSHGLNFNWFQREMFDLYVSFTLFGILLTFLLYMLLGRIGECMGNYHIQRRARRNQPLVGRIPRGRNR